MRRYCNFKMAMPLEILILQYTVCLKQRFQTFRSGRWGPSQVSGLGRQKTALFEFVVKTILETDVMIICLLSCSWLFF
jgi:hypothetical protein